MLGISGSFNKLTLQSMRLSTLMNNLHVIRTIGLPSLSFLVTNFTVDIVVLAVVISFTSHMTFRTQFLFRVIFCGDVSKTDTLVNKLIEGDKGLSRSRRMFNW